MILVCTCKQAVTRNLQSTAADAIQSSWVGQTLRSSGDIIAARAKSQSLHPQVCAAYRSHNHDHLARKFGWNCFGKLGPKAILADFNWRSAHIHTQINCWVLNLVVPSHPPICKIVKFPAIRYFIVHGKYLSIIRCSHLNVHYSGTTESTSSRCETRSVLMVVPIFEMCA